MSLTVVSVNSAQQPKWIPGAMGYQDARAKQLAEDILAHDPDVVCIQELFRKGSQKIVRDHLKEELPYFYIDTSCGKYIIGVNSGLAIFSRYPISNQSLYRYKVYRGVENWAEKGVMHVTVDFEDTSVEVFTTHLQTGLGAEPCICKYFDRNQYSSDQLKEMQVNELINQAKKYEGNPMIIAGDFNIRAESDVYDVVAGNFEETLQVNDVFDASKSPCSSSVVGKTDHRIDYVWTNVKDAYYIILEPWKRKNGEFVGPKVDPKVFVTDHHAIIGFINIA